MKTSTWITGAVVAAMGLTAVVAQAQDSRSEQGDRSERRGMMFEELDTNGDGQLTLEEMTARGAERFASADTNGDALLSADEMNAAAAARIAERTERMIKRMDKDADGMLSAQEMQSRRDPAKMFERVDRNGDGAVSEEEFAQARKRMQGHHGKARHHEGKQGAGNLGDHGRADDDRG